MDIISNNFPGRDQTGLDFNRTTSSLMMALLVVKQAQIKGSRWAASYHVFPRQLCSVDNTAQRNESPSLCAIEVGSFQLEQRPGDVATWVFQVPCLAGGGMLLYKWGCDHKKHVICSRLKPDNGQIPGKTSTSRSSLSLSCGWMLWVVLKDGPLQNVRREGESNWAWMWNCMHAKVWRVIGRTVY